MKNEHRHDSRQTVEMPVQVAGGVSGLTRDISASGLFFQADAHQSIGSVIDIEIELSTPGGPLKLIAQGEVVRIEPSGDRTGVAVKVLTSRLVAPMP